MDDLKRCYSCKLSLPKTLFTKNKSKRDGLADFCRSCKAEDRKRYALKYPEKVKAQKVRHKARHKARHPDKYRARSARYYAENKERLICKSREWKLKNPEKVKAMHSAWRRANPEKANAQRGTADPLKAKTRSKRRYIQLKESGALPNQILCRKYVSKLLQKSMGIDIQITEIPPELVDVKTQQLKLKRLLKEKSK